MEKPAVHTLVLCDFDGTIATNDMGYDVISRFAGEGWGEINRAYCAGEIGSMEAYRKTAALFKVSREEITRYVLDHVTVDDHFEEFASFCRESGYEIKIVSDGLDFYIDAVLKNIGLDDIEFYSNVLIFEDERRVSVEFPGLNSECLKCGNCKSSILKGYRSSYDMIMYIGDGYSDICPAQDADLVFAKSLLYNKLKERGKECIHCHGFSDILRYLKARNNGT